MVMWVGFAIALALAAGPGEPDAAVELGPTLAAMRDFARHDGERLWPGYGTASFEFLLIDGSTETLLCRAAMPAGFTPTTDEPATHCRQATRARSDLPAGLLAAMPVFGPPATIAMGTPAATGRAPGDWQRTILHEHFHQWQYALPHYYDRAAALDLAGPDKSAMWMLNFPFPYADADVAAAYRAASLALADALAARNTPRLHSAVAHFLDSRAAFAAKAGERNWHYLDFQLWQEGVARWTEITLGKRYPDAAVRAMAESLEQRTLAALRTPDLAKQGRELAYPYGAGEAMLLEACGRDWRRAYPALLGLTPLWEAARRRCT